MFYKDKHEQHAVIKYQSRQQLTNAISKCLLPIVSEVFSPEILLAQTHVQIKVAILQAHIQNSCYSLKGHQGQIPGLFWRTIKRKPFSSSIYTRKNGIYLWPWIERHDALINSKDQNTTYHCSIFPKESIQLCLSIIWPRKTPQEDQY